MQVMFMCGGKGRRLQSSHSGPKSLTPIGNSTLLSRLIDQLAPFHTSANPPLVVVDEHDRQTPDALGSRLPAAHVIRQPTPDGVANALLLARPRLDDVFLMVLGDLFFDGRFAPFPRRASLLSWCGAPPQETRSNFGIATGADGRVSAVVEKPTDVAGLKCGVGLYVLTRPAVDCFARAPIDAATGERGITAGIDAALACGVEFSHVEFRGFYRNVNRGADLVAIDHHLGASKV